MKPLSENRRARFDYDIQETYEAGIVLTGQEAKSAKNGGLHLSGSFVTFSGNNAYLTGATISPYPYAGALPDYDPGHSRRLLLRRKEINYLRERTQEAGLTALPLKAYAKQSLVKIEVALARGRKQYDKREAIKKIC
ncbi:MAG: SsrA-binding protein SmpB [Candidatus Magasanikbacteria bacterium]|nr:SsrA-binding protein SmpB [Candidatus Magasanikbacteria bacterium]